MTNPEPAKSLGGPQSKYMLGGGINSLFDNATDEGTDYRCFYVVNRGKSAIRKFALYLKEPLGGTTVDLGLLLQPETQTLTVQGSPASGWFYLKFHNNRTGRTHQTRRINWTPDAATMSNRIAAILNSLQIVKVTCDGSQTDSGWSFPVAFAGHRGESLLEVVKATGVSVMVEETLPGGPINLNAPEIGFPTNPPTGVKFYEVAKAPKGKKQKVTVGMLRPGDFVAVWLRRTVAAGTTQQRRDKLSVVLSGEV